MRPTPVQQARHRLEVLWADNATGETPEHCVLSIPETEALRLVLDEVHRLNLVVSKQEARLRAARKRNRK